MLGLLTGQKVSPIAVDFGACSLRAVQLVREGAAWRIYHWVNVEVEPTSTEPPDIDHGAHLRMALGPGAFTGTRAAIALAPPDIEYRLLDLPSALLARKPGELREALQFELDRQLPWPARETEMAYWPVGEAAGGTTTSTMVVAGRTQAIQGYLDLLGAQELECVLADISPNALIRLHARQHSGPAPHNVLWGALDIGFRACRLYLIHDDRLVYARILRGGGRELTDTLARGLHTEFTIAEQYKRLYGIQPTDRSVRASVSGLGRVDEQALPGMIYAILAGTIETLVREIEKSYRFALDRIPSASTGGLLLVGGGARLKGLGEVMAHRLGIEVRLPDPALAVANARTADGFHTPCTPFQFPALAACVGLAMKEDLT